MTDKEIYDLYKITLEEYNEAMQGLEEWYEEHNEEYEPF